jgi:predicted Zn-dependent protease
VSLRPYSRIFLAAVLSLSVSCADIAAPNRTNAYEWRRLLPAGSRVQALSFHWPSSSLPVRIWADNSLNLPAHAEHGIREWEGAFLYGEFRGVMGSDSNAADVLVFRGIAPSVGFSTARLESMAPECLGATDVELTPDSLQVVAPIRVYVDLRVEPTAPGVDECMALTTTHELGHALGIFAHSPDVDDIMYSDPTVPTLSPRDRSTVELAYHTEPTLSLAPR